MIGGGSGMRCDKERNLWRVGARGEWRSCARDGGLEMGEMGR
jgi:hypothetical protein